MLALVLDQGVHLVSDYPEPTRLPGEALLQVRLSGICDTDLQLARGYMKFRGVLGHEFVADVLAADNPQWIGKRVVGDINAGCGDCEDCRYYGGHHCAKRTVLGIDGRDGVFAERFCLPERCLVGVPHSVDDERAVFAEPLAAAIHVLDAVAELTQQVTLSGYGKCEPPREALVIGDGKLGLLVAMVLAVAGMSVTQIGHHPRKLQVLGRRGIPTLLEEQLGDTSRRFPLVVEASGSHTGFARALSLVAPRGTLVQKSTVTGTTQAELSTLVVNEIRLLGSRCGNLGHAMAWLEQGRVDPRDLIDGRFPLEQAEHAFAQAATRGVSKILLAPVGAE
jgi:threonine dehydrogenase-like Zn-dependent dehydrogenase